MRADVGRLIRGTGEPGPLRRLLADLWPALATIYLVVLFVSRLYEVLLGDTEPSNAAIGSIVLVLVLPLADMLLCRITAAAMRSRTRDTTASAGETSTLAGSFEPVLRRAIHIVVVVSGLVILADLWNIDPMAIAERSVGGRIAERASRHRRHDAARVDPLGDGADGDRSAHERRNRLPGQDRRRACGRCCRCCA